MMPNGTRPALLDKRDYSFHRTFPQFAAIAPAALPILDYSFDAGLTMPNQIADGYPVGCTGYAQTDCKTDQEKKIYDPGYTFKKTCYMEGHDLTSGADIRTSAKSLRVYGAKLGSSSAPEAEVTPEDDTAAKENKSGQSYNVDKAPGRDWFDSFRIALRSQMNNPVKNTISIGTIWFPEWGSPTSSGLLPDQFEYNGNRYSYAWHDYKICGEHTVNGEPTLEVKSWQGRDIGNGGFLYLNRAAFNKAYDIYGTLALMTAQARPEDIRTIQIDIIQTILTYIERLLAIARNKVASIPQIRIHA